MNACAGRVARDPRLLERLAAQVPASHFAVTERLEQVPEAIGRLRALGVETLVIVGGDGSVTGALSPLLANGCSDLPRILLAGGGTVNTISRSLGGRGRPELQLERLLRNGPRSETRRCVLAIEAGREAVRHGMIFVLGAPNRFLRFYYERSSLGPLGAAYSLASCVTSILRNGPLARELFRSFPVEIRLDGVPSGPERATILGASSVRDVGLGFRPFTSAGSELGRFHWLAGDPDARALVRALPGIRLGLPGALGLLEHASTSFVELRTGEPLPYSIDAELSSEQEEFRVEAGPVLRFLTA